MDSKEEINNMWEKLQAKEDKEKEVKMLRNQCELEDAGFPEQRCTFSMKIMNAIIIIVCLHKVCFAGTLPA